MCRIAHISESLKEIHHCLMKFYATASFFVFNMLGDFPYPPWNYDYEELGEAPF